jgi:rfaE bifunctional protein kinase chain/domain
MDNLLERIRSVKCLVLGDLILDKYIFGQVSKISREAPIPILQVESEEYRLGGAANTANNLKQLCDEVFVGGIIGADFFSKKLKELLEVKGINCKYLREVDNKSISVKQRFVAKKHQLLRVDYDSNLQASRDLMVDLLNSLEEDLGQFDCILVSDHDLGSISSAVFDRFYDWRQKALVSLDNRPLFLDTRHTNFPNLKYTSVLKFNELDASMVYGSKLANLSDLSKFAEKIFSKNLSEALIVTLGEKGCFWATKDKSEYLEAAKVEVSDVTGAGDTFLAVCGLGFVVSKSLSISCRLANRASAKVVSKFGTAVVAKEEISEEIKNLLW